MAKKSKSKSQPQPNAIPEFKGYTTADGKVLSKRLDYEEEIFRTSTQYYIALRSETGIGSWKRYEFKTYPEAMVYAIKLSNAAEEQARDELIPLLYVVRDSDQAGFNMPHNEFPRYLQIYNELTGQKLQMPSTYRNKGHSYDRQK